MTHAIPATFGIGHYTDEVALTGCTVILFDQARPTAVDIRGGAPGTRETDLLSPGTLVGSVDAILLTGGSSYGLGAAQGVMDVLRERGRGVMTTAGPVPIVTAAVIFDLAIGKPSWPGPLDARAACHAVVDPTVAEVGRVGAGTGATTNKMVGTPKPGGFGIASRRVGDVVVWACAVVNAAGAVDGSDPRGTLLENSPILDDRSSTALVSVVIVGPADDRTRRRCAVTAHDAMARKIVPCHTIWDGDVVFVTSDDEGHVNPAEVFRLAVATELAVEEAIVTAVR